MAWNKPSEGAAKPAPKKPSAMRGILAGLVVVCALGGLCLWLFSGNDAAPKAKPEKERGRIKAVAPVAAPTNAVPAKPIDPREDYDHDLCFRDEKGILRYKANPSLWAYDKSRKCRKTTVGGWANRPSPFKHSAEREIAALLTAQPGQRRYAYPNYSSPDFLESFEASLKEPTVINEDDTPDDVELKKAVADAKREISDRMRQGEKLADILRETKLELDRLVQYKDELDAQIRSIIRDGDGKFSTRDVLDCVDAANKMLEEKGIAAIQPDTFVIENIRQTAKVLGSSPDEEEAAEDAALDELEKEKEKQKK